MKLRTGQCYILGLVLLALGGCALGYLLEPYNISASTTWGIMCIIYTGGFLIGKSSEMCNLPREKEIKGIINHELTKAIMTATPVGDVAKALAKRIGTN
ncbi:hypothetical protein LCGC14_1479350 [marine sediment metagenome]|uniref:Uncharacterized protein n=1 Tax=marine sediment metagenome TaxID=412755 RepID=A0A0F9LQC5_9ZZZZ